METKKQQSKDIILLHLSCMVPKYSIQHYAI